MFEIVNIIMKRTQIKNNLNSNCINFFFFKSKYDTSFWKRKKITGCLKGFQKIGLQSF